MKVLDTIAKTRDAVSVGRVFGEPYEKDGLTIIPAAFVSGGGGGGEAESGDSGGGFGLIGFPVGAYVVKDGEVRWQPAVNVNLIAVVALLTLRTVLRIRHHKRR
jgi:uncharacterized spore protein YtfJ